MKKTLFFLAIASLFAAAAWIAYKVIFKKEEEGCMLTEDDEYDEDDDPSFELDDDTELAYNSGLNI